jgi:hypothetical protein
VSVDFEFHPEMLAILPVVAIGAAQCECCEEMNYCLVLGWLCWSLEFTNAGHD